jgi:hypothetical protein
VDVVVEVVVLVVVEVVTPTQATQSGQAGVPPVAHSSNAVCKPPQSSRPNNASTDNSEAALQY